MAAPEDHGRWSDFGDSSSSSLSPLELIIFGGLLFLVSLFFIIANKGKDGSRGDFWLGIVGFASVIIVILVKCS